MTEAGLERVAGDAAPVLDRVTRLGFATKGLLTILVGVLALRHALGQGGRLTGQEGAIRTLRDQPFGQVALVVLTVGLSAYALWMFVSAFVDPQGKGTRIVGIVERVQGTDQLPDKAAYGLPSEPEAVYAVAFASHDLWGESDESPWTVVLDLFDTYLEPV